MRLRPNGVLLKLPPQRDRLVKLVAKDLDAWIQQDSATEFGRVVKAQPVEHPIGVVVQVGKATQDVWPGDLVLLEPDVVECAQYVDLPDERGLPWPHLFVSENDIQAVIEREA